MRKKILTVLAPVLAIMAFAVLPAMAQAQTLQINGSPAGFGDEIQAFSSNLTSESALGNYECEENDLNIFMTGNLTGQVNGGYFQNSGGGPCSLGELEVTSTTNAGTVGWRVQLEAGQQGTLEPIAPGAKISFADQIQSEEISVATCTYERASVPFTYNDDEKDLVLTVNSVEFNGGACGSKKVKGTFTITGTVSFGQVTVDP